MPPKKTRQAAKAVSEKKATEKKAEETQTKPEDTVKIEAQADAKTADEPPTEPKKRKTPPTASSTPSRKEPRTGTKAASSRGQNPATPAQLLKYLLSAASLPLCYPADELAAPPDSRTYARTSPARFTPFEHLLVASLLAKPLSHRLGLRAARTLLNAPWALRDPRAVVDKGEREVWRALEAARTQHRQKTASYIFQIGEKFEDDPLLEGLKEDPMAGVQKVKGMGKMASELFVRRVQCVKGWEGNFPFADMKSLEALKELGVDVKSADDLEAAMGDVEVEKMGNMGLRDMKGVDGEQKKRIAFVLLLERAIGASLAGNVMDVRRQAAAVG